MIVYNYNEEKIQILCHAAGGWTWEGEARLLFTIESGNHVEPKVVISKEFSWMMASLDGVSENGTVAIEIKCPGLEDHDKAVNGRVPENMFLSSNIR